MPGFPRVALLSSDPEASAWLSAAAEAGLALTPYRALTTAVREPAAGAWRRAADVADGLVFTSPNGVLASAALRAPSPGPYVAVGPATARAAQAAGYGPPLAVAAPPHDAEALASCLTRWPGRRWAWPCGDRAGHEWRAGLEVSPVTVYETRAELAGPEGERLRRALEAGEHDWIALLSPSGVESLAALGLGPEALGRVQLAALGKRTAQALAERLGRAPDALPARNAKEALLAAIAEASGRRA